MTVQHPAVTIVVVLLLCLQTSALALDDVGNVVQVPQVTSEALAEDTSLQVAAEAEETQSLSIGSGVIFVAGVAMLGIIGYVVYRQHRRNVAKEHDNQLMQSLLDSEMDYAAM